MEQEKVSEILDMLDAGVSPMAIGQEMGVSTQTVRNIQQTHGRQAQGVGRPSAITAEQEVAIAEAYESGEPIGVILAKFSIQRPQLYNILSKHSVPTRRVIMKNSRLRAMEEAIQMYVDGALVRQITEDTGIHQPTLHAELARRGIPLRRPRANR